MNLIHKICSIAVISLFGGIISGSFAAPPVAPQQFQLDFSSKYQVGSRYSCDLTAELFKLTRLKSTADSSTRRRSMKIKLSGTMIVNKLDSVGMITEADLEIKRFTGFIDNGNIKSKLNGKKLSIIFTRGKNAQFWTKGDKYLSLSRHEKSLLSLLFPSIFDENLADLLGKPRKVAVGITWQPPGKKFFSLFKQHGIKFSQNKVKSQAKISKYETFNKTKCLIIEEQLKTLNVADFKFNFHLKVWFPVNNLSGNAYRIQRQSVWNASASLPGNGPLVAGYTVSTIVVNSLDFVLIPILH